MKLSIIPVLFALAFLLVPPMSSFGSSITTNPDVMYVCDAPAFETNEIHRINFTTGQKISSVTMTGTTIVGCTGLAVDPTDGTYYIGIKTEGDGASFLGTIIPSTGVITSIGEVEAYYGNGITNLAFNSTGHLFANANRFPLDTGEVYRLDKTTGSIESTCTPLPNKLSIISIFGSTEGTDQVIFWNGTEFHGLGRNATVEHNAEFIPNSLISQPNPHEFWAIAGRGITYYSLAYNWSTDQMFSHADAIPNQMWELTDMEAFDCGVVPHTVMTDNWNSDLPFFAGVPQSMTFDTVTNSFYANVASWIGYISNLVSISPTAQSGILSSELIGELNINQVPSPPTDLKYEAGDYHEAHIIFNDTQYDNGGIFFKGMAFELVLTPPDSISPVISATVSEPISIIQDSSFDAFEFVDCNDDVDGAIVPNGDFATDGGITIDTSTRGSQLQDYTCTDSADNNTLETIQYIIKKKSSSGGGSSSTSSGTSSQSSIPQLSDIPTLSFKDSPSQQTPTPARTGQSISDLFANLFADRLNPTENIPQAQSVFNSGQSSGSPASDRSSPVADFFRNLFSGFSGFFN